MLKTKKNSLILASKRARGRERGCAFCKGKTTPKWEDYEKLTEYLSPRGRIIAAQFSGTCVKHQRILCRVIKQARHLALLPFVTKEE